MKATLAGSVKFEGSNVDPGSETNVDTGQASRLAAVRQQIDAACHAAGRDLASVTLVAVSKTFGPEAIEPVIAAGQADFGENRVQEAKAKWPALLARQG